MQIDAVDKREDFELWYADGDTFLTPNPDPTGTARRTVLPSSTVWAARWHVSAPTRTRSSTTWASSATNTSSIPTRSSSTISSKGMLWDIMGSITQPPLDFRNEGTGKSDVRISHVKEVQGQEGPLHRDQGEGPLEASHRRLLRHRHGDQETFKGQKKKAREPVEERRFCEVEEPHLLKQRATLRRFRQPRAPFLCRCTRYRKRSPIRPTERLACLGRDVLREVGYSMRPRLFIEASSVSAPDGVVSAALDLT